VIRLFQPTGSDHSGFWFDGADPGQWDGEVGRACEAAVADWRRFLSEAEGILAPVIPDGRLRQRLAGELADAAFPEAFSPACQLWFREEQELSLATLHEPLPG
jgi:hypothetical protein